MGDAKEFGSCEGNSGVMQFQGHEKGINGHVNVVKVSVCRGLVFSIISDLEKVTFGNENSCKTVCGNHRHFGKRRLAFGKTERNESIINDRFTMFMLLGPLHKKRESSGKSLLAQIELSTRPIDKSKR